MTSEQLNVLKELVAEGHAVVVITPEELNGADPDLVEDRLIELSWDVIDTLTFAES